MSDKKIILHLLEDDRDTSKHIKKTIERSFSHVEVVQYFFGRALLDALDSVSETDLFVLDGKLPDSEGGPIGNKGPQYYALVRGKFPFAPIIGHSNTPEVFLDARLPCIDKTSGYQPLIDWIEQNIPAYT